MTMQNFRFDVDADGVALITWDMPGRSMNVLTPEAIEELERARRQGRRRRRDQGRGRHLRQGDLLRRRRSHDAARHGARIRARRQGGGRGEGDARLLRPLAPAVAHLPQARELRQTLRRGDQRRLPGRRLRARARLPLSRRRRQRQGARRPAGDQGRPVPRRRRHAARRAADADARRAADAVPRRPAQARRGQEDGPRPRRRAGRRNRRAGEGMGEGQSGRQGAVGRPEIQGRRRARCSRRPA